MCQVAGGHGGIKITESHLRFQFIFIHTLYIYKNLTNNPIFSQEDNIGNNLTHIVRKHHKFIKSQRGKLNNSIS